MHIPVLLKEVIENLQPQKNNNCIDCTLGGGGHALKLLKKIGPNGKLLGFDWDAEAIKSARKILHEYENRISLVNESYIFLEDIVAKTKFNKVSIILCDLGFSSNQLEDANRSFSFNFEGKIDLRYSDKNKLTGDEIVNEWPVEELVRILKDYGEERLARKIASEIIISRKNGRLIANDIKAICNKIYKQSYKRPTKVEPATKTWQAIRVAVNNEFENIKVFLPQTVKVLVAGGRLGIITFHSLEDRIVKNYFKTEARDCICPPEIPVCRCGHKAQLKIITKKPIVPSQSELNKNPRARSAKLRIIEKL